MEKSHNELSENNYWNKHYEKKIKKPITIRPKINLATHEMDLFFKKNLPVNDKFKFIEIGCAPGAWMHYFYKNFKYNIEGIEYTKQGYELTRSNLRLLGCSPKIYHDDFLKNSLDKNSYDVVFSAGFIEHFNNVDDVVRKHVELLREGGFLVLEVPNFNGFNYYYQKLLNKNNLEIHNIDIMNIEYFESISQKFNLKMIDVQYIGKINMGLFVGNKFLLYIGYAIQLVLSRMYFLFGCKFFKDSKYLSPFIVGVYQK